MKTNIFRSRATRPSDSGQVMLFVLLGLGLFLIGAMAFAIDMSNLWFNRQAAQTAADAACTAGAMDMLVDYTNGTTGQGGFTVSGSPTPVDCSTSQTPAPCQYATLNGFNSGISRSSANSGTLGNNVTFQVNGTAPLGLPPGSIPPSTVASNPFLSVKITDNIPTFFAGMLRGTTKQNIGATAICGVLEATSPIPILVLHPTMSGALHMNGGGSVSNPTCSSGPPCGDIVVAGGPAKSIQVNSSSATAVSTGTNPTINLCGGNSSYCGSSMGVWGTNTTPTGFWNTVSTCSPPNKTNGNCTGTQTAPQWNSPSPPIADPLASLTAPAQPSAAGTKTTVAATVHGCPFPTGSTKTCSEYTPGYYLSGIDVSADTAIFQPGIYYLKTSVCNNGGSNDSLCEDQNSCIRPSTQPGDGSGGVIFYFADANSVGVGSNGGKCNRGEVPFQTFSGSGSIPYGVKCTPTSQVPANLATVTTLSGSVLLAPCTAPTVTALCTPNCTINNGTGFGDPLGLTDPYGVQRGVLFFQNRAVNASNNPNWGGGGSMLLAGTMYFHQTSSYGDLLNLGGNAGSKTYVLGDIIVDQLTVGGSGQIVMDLNPSAAYTTLKASLLQ